jgi:hypothetical protein
MIEFIRGIRISVSTVLIPASARTCRELPIPVSDEKARPTAHIVQVHHEIPDLLDDPAPAPMSGDAQHADAPGGMLDDGQDVLALPVRSDDLDEIASQQGVGLRAQEAGPGGGRPSGRWIEAFLFEDFPDGGRRDLDAEGGELSVYPPTAPAGILPDQAQDEGADGVDGGWAPGPLRPAGAGVTPFHQIAVPAAKREAATHAAASRTMGFAQARRYIVSQGRPQLE